MTIATLVPVLLITALVQLFKESLGLPSKYAKITAFVLAVVFGTLFYLSASLTETVVAILGYGLAAVGLWEVGGQRYKELRGLETGAQAPSTPTSEMKTPEHVDSD